ncbi:MAG: hypothetical protein GXY03_12980 [Solirubrobacterales bacterium]|nr:hypothetical protein [Solirubrobacterales bacterium]
MTTATATAWVTDRLAQTWRDGPAVGGTERGGMGRRRAAGQPVRPVGGRRLTLEQKLDSVWEGLRTDGAAECPVCHGAMEGAGGGRARCRDCGSELS